MDEAQGKKFEEAQKDMEWIKKIRMAKTADELVRLYEEKGIVLKEEISVYPLNQTRQLEDEELDEVAGGGFFGECPREYNVMLCIASFCPHVQTLRNTPKIHQTTTRCDYDYWQYISNDSDDSRNRPRR